MFVHKSPCLLSWSSDTKSLTDTIHVLNKGNRIKYVACSCRWGTWSSTTLRRRCYKHIKAAAPQRTTQPVGWGLCGTPCWSEQHTALLRWRACPTRWPQQTRWPRSTWCGSPTSQCSYLRTKQSRATGWRRRKSLILSLGWGYLSAVTTTHTSHWVCCTQEWTQLSFYPTEITFTDWSISHGGSKTHRNSCWIVCEGRSTFKTATVDQSRTNIHKMNKLYNSN